MSEATTETAGTPAAAAAPPVPTVVLPPRRTRTKDSLTIRESGIVVYGLEKLAKSPVPNVPWFSEMFTKDQIDAATTIAGLYAAAAIEEQEASLPELKRIAAATQDEKLKKQVEDVIKNQHYIAEQRAKGKLEHLDSVVEAVKRQHADRMTAAANAEELANLKATAVDNGKKKK